MRSKIIESECDRSSVWIVDDEPDFRQFVRTVAELKAWTVREFAAGTELINAMENLPAPKLIVLDLVMPGMDGIEAIVRMSEFDQRAQILIVSGKHIVYGTTAEHLSMESNLNVIGKIPKPVSVDELRTYLDLADSRRETA